MLMNSHDNTVPVVNRSANLLGVQTASVDYTPVKSANYCALMSYDVGLDLSETA